MYRNLNFKKLFGAFSITFLGDGLTIAAVPWLISMMTKDTFYASIVMTALRLPWLLFSLPVGLLIDHFSRKRMLIAASTLRMFLLFFLTLIIWFDWINIPLLALFMFGIGISRVVFDSTVQTIIPQIVEDKDLEKANGQFTAGQLITSDILGVALGGFIITLNMVYPFMFDTITAMLALILVAALKGNFMSTSSDVHQQKPSMRNWKKDIWAGIEYVRNDAYLKMLAWLSAVITLMYSVVLSTQVFFVREALRLDVFTFSILISIATVGSIISTQLITVMRKKWSLKQLIIYSIFIMGISYGIVGLTTNVYVVGLLYFCAAFFIVVYNVARSAILQRSVPNHILGRVGSVFRLLAFGFSAIGILLGGLLVQLSSHYFDRTFSLQLPYLLLGIVYIVCCLFCIFKIGNQTKSLSD